jgi:hypothetical protein
MDVVESPGTDRVRSVSGEGVASGGRMILVEPNIIGVLPPHTEPLLEWSERI